MSIKKTFASLIDHRYWSEILNRNEARTLDSTVPEAAKQTQTFWLDSTIHVCIFSTKQLELRPNKMGVPVAI